MEQVVSFEVAQKEVSSWLEAKRLSAKKLAGQEKPIEDFIDGVENGILSINEKREITHKLQFPIKDDQGNDFLSELVYKPRLTVQDIEQRLKGSDATNPDARILAYASALTGKAVSLLKKLDTVDYAIVQTIAVFFI